MLETVTGFEYLGPVIWDTPRDSRGNSSIDKVETSLEWQEYFSQLSGFDWCASLSHPPSCVHVNHGPSQQSSRAEYKPWGKKLTADRMPFSHLKPLTAKYVYQVWQNEWDETVLVSNKFHEILPKLPDKLLSFSNTRKDLNRLHMGHSFLTHSFILRKEEAPVCVACNAVITVKHILI